MSLNLNRLRMYTPDLKGEGSLARSSCLGPAGGEIPLACGDVMFGSLFSSCCLDTLVGPEYMNASHSVLPT